MAGEPERLESNKRKPFEKGEGRVCRYCSNYRSEEEMGGKGDYEANPSTVDLRS